MKKVLLFLTLALSPFVSSAQKKSLTEAEFFPIVRRAGEATYAVPHKSVTTNREVVEGEAVVAYVQIKESPSTESSRLVQTKGKEVIEVISVGRKNFQRENNGPWREVGTPENVYLFRTIGGPHTSEYYSEDIVLQGRSYRVLTWYVKELSGRFSENKTFIAGNGKIFREEARGGTLRPENVDWDEVVNYEYNLGPMKIVAPNVRNAKTPDSRVTPLKNN